MFKVKIPVLTTYKLSDNEWVLLIIIMINAKSVYDGLVILFYLIAPRRVNVEWNLCNYTEFMLPHFKEWWHNFLYIHFFNGEAENNDNRDNTLEIFQGEFFSFWLTLRWTW